MIVGNLLAVAVVSLGACLQVSASKSRVEASASAVTLRKYTRAHELADDYSFDPRDGWMPLNFTDEPYKYDTDTGGELEARSGKKRKAKGNKSSSTLGGVIGGAVKSIFKGLLGVGKPDPVTVTWYTGQDLKNPSCWANTKWAPTDDSFACALTMEGWKEKPKCFTFHEVCNGSKKCIFVRVIDTCAGCKKGSHHVDMTRAAFKELADFDTGIFTGQWRAAKNTPEVWDERLWGPKH